MSIIQEALKKAQDDFKEKEVPQEKSRPAQQEPVKKEEENKRSLSMRLPALVSILAILLLAYGLKLSMQYTRSHDSASKARKNAAEPGTDKKVVTDSSGIFGQANKINPVKFMDPRQSLLVLNGIMYVENRPQAIINGQVLEEGDRISGATVLVIEKDCVLLDMNDTNVRLDIKK